ncbi:hypothetical protein HP456_15020 [Bacillus haikouensis]|jgi:hypothetical protein|uniref:hypothetical protein n=1 Tax=Bacillus haikouensis TaxID=1510468 RepID=UPI00155391ED|nr:hypothetical protein [Bacillus haikouensis]NQD67225.1 hypothetical protein [Bacillus haikouensis]
MGYIAPIPHHQYKQYQEREMKVEKHPYRFFPVQPVKALKNKSKQTDHEEIHTQPYRESNHNDPPSRIGKFQKTFISSELLAQLTGKGANINEYV